MKFPLNKKKNEIPDLAKVSEYIGHLREGRYAVEIERVRAKRSLGQNALYHGVWLPIITDSLGYIDPEEVCRAIKIKLGYCTTQIDKITGGKKWICQSTGKFNSVEMSLFLEKVEVLARELDISLPSKEQV